MKNKKEYGRGGKREGSGRPRQFEQPTTINFKAEKSDVEAAKKKAWQVAKSDVCRMVEVARKIAHNIRSQSLLYWMMVSDLSNNTTKKLWEAGRK